MCDCRVSREVDTAAAACGGTCLARGGRSIAMMILLMGVSGAGKTTVGRELARQLGWTFLDADDDHPVTNREKMRSGVPLLDEDRVPWLAAVRARVRVHLDAGENVVLACSGLREAHRRYLAEVDRDVAQVLLTAPEDVLRSRMTERTGHYMPAILLESQLQALEMPPDATIVDGARPVNEVVSTIRDALHVRDS